MVLLPLLLLLAAPPALRAQDANVERVPVDLYVMSKCPDAVFAEKALAPVLQELKAFTALMLHFIGIKQDDGGWACKHGQPECDGDVQELCVQLHSKPYQKYDWLYRFVLCGNRDLEAVGQFVTAAKCLKETNVPLAASTKMLGCMYAPGKDDLLREEFERTDAAGIHTSATILIDGKVACVRDGGEWKDCDGVPAGADGPDFRSALCAAAAAKNRGRLPPSCRPATA